MSFKSTKKYKKKKRRYVIDSSSSDDDDDTDPKETHLKSDDEEDELNENDENEKMMEIDDEEIFNESFNDGDNKNEQIVDDPSEKNSEKLNRPNLFDNEELESENDIQRKISLKKKNNRKRKRVVSDSDSDVTDNSDIIPENIPSQNEKLKLCDPEKVVEPVIIAQPKTEEVNYRLFINKIDIKGFKSYREIEIIGPYHEKVNCIVGSNGSGKSNIIDAICFVFGFESKHLRSKNVKSLINNELVKRNDYSSVAIHFKVCEENVENKHFSIKREAYSNNTSSYFLKDIGENRFSKVSKKKINSVLLSYKIDLNFPERFIILQNNTTNLANKKPLQLLEYLEGLIGTNVIKKKIEVIDESIQEKLTLQTEIREKLKTIEKVEGNLKPNVDMFYLCLKKTTEKVLFEKKYYSCKFEKNKGKLEEFKEQRSKINLSVCREKKESLEKEISKIKNKLDVFDKENSRILLEKNKIEEKYDFEREENVKNQFENTRINKKISKKKKKKKNIKNEIKEFKNKEMKLEESLENFEGLLKEKENELENFQLDETFDSKKHSKIENDIKQIESNSQYKSLKIKRDKQKTKLEITSKINDMSGSCSSNQMQLEYFEKTIVSLNNDIEKLSNKLQEFEKTKKTKRMKMEEVKNKKFLLEKEKTELLLKTQDLGMQQTNNFLSICAKLRKEKICIDSLSRLGEVKKEYFFPVNIIFQGILRNSIVCENKEQGLRTIEYFRKNKIGIVTCEILSEIPPNYYNNTSKTPTGLIYLPSVIKSDEKYSVVFKKYGFNWYIAKNRKTALRLSKSGKNIITMSGEVFRASGEIRTNNKVNFQITIPKENEKQKDVFVGDSNNLLSELGNIKNKIDNLNGSLNHIKNELVLVNRNKNETENLLFKKRQKISSLNHEKRKIFLKQKNLQEEMDELEKEKSSFSLKQDEKEMLQNFDKQLSILKQKLGPIEKMRTIQSEVEQLEYECLKINKKIEKFPKKKMKLEKKLLSIKIKPLEDEYSEKKKIIKETYKKIENLYNQISKTKLTLNDLSKKKKDCEIFEEELLLKLKNVEEEFGEKLLRENFLIKKIDQVKKKLKGIQKKLKEIEDRIEKDEDEMDIDSNDEEKRQEEKLNSKELKYEIEELGREVKEMKSKINISEIEEHLKLKEKSKNLKINHNKYSSEIEELSTEREKLSELRFCKFNQNCKQINQNLTMIFKELNTQGNGYLNYPEEKTACFEEGVTYFCKPEGFEWKNFNKLSGGQQGFSQVCLTMSMLKCFPSPIVFYDELDAHLDTINVEKIAQLLESFSDSHQFLIITLKYQMYAKANKMFGVYQRNNTSRTICSTFVDYE